jgi:hypothetical protein
VVKVDYICQTVRGPESGLENKKGRFLHKDCVLEGDKICQAGKEA